MTMLKEVTPTPEMLNRIAQVTGADSIDPSGIAIFECVALNTQPLTKFGSIYENATATPGLLSDMAAYLKAGNGVPLHTLHMQGYELPVGKVFMADTNGDNELRALFFVNRPTSEGQRLAADLNAGIIDEVSVGILPKALRCSECGWDFFGPDATLAHLFDRTCANDHVIGKDGVHAVLDGLDKWSELSLVSRGAAKNAKIVGRARQVLGQDAYNQLAASGRDPEVTMLFASLPQTTTKEIASMAENPNQDLKAGFELIAAMSADKAKADLALAAAEGKIAELTARAEAAEGKVAELETKVAEAAEAVKLKEDHAAMQAFLAEQTKAALVAAGHENPAVPEDVAGMLAALKDSGLKLHNLIAGGAKAEAAAEVPSVSLSASTDAYRIRK